MLVVGLIGLGTTIVLVTVVPSYSVSLGVVAVLGAFYATAIPETNKAVFNATQKSGSTFRWGSSRWA